MGTWTVISMDPRIERQTTLYGHVFTVVFFLKYTPSGAFRDEWKEMPTLEWGEVISMYRRDQGTYWEYVGDQYNRNPKSPTFGNWTYRYTRAYDSIAFKTYGKASSIHLFDKNGGQIKQNMFTETSAPKQKKINDIRRYLQRKGGILRIPVRDIPAINKPRAGENIHKERLLRFDCGLKGFSMRVRAYQYLEVNSALPQSQWKQEFRLGVSSHRISTTGLRKVAVPNNVSIPKPARTNEKIGFVL